MPIKTYSVTHGYVSFKLPTFNAFDEAIVQVALLTIKHTGRIAWTIDNSSFSSAKIQFIIRMIQKYKIQQYSRYKKI